MATPYTPAQIDARVAELNAKRRLANTRRGVAALHCCAAQELKEAYYAASCGLDNMVDVLTAACKAGVPLATELEIAVAARKALEQSRLGIVM